MVWACLRQAVALWDACAPTEFVWYLQHVRAVDRLARAESALVQVQAFLVTCFQTFAVLPGTGGMPQGFAAEELDAATALAACPQVQGTAVFNLVTGAASMRAKSENLLDRLEDGEWAAVVR